MVKRIKYTGYTETKLKILIDKHTVEENEAMRAHRKGKARSMYASDYGQCMRKTWYQFFPEEYPQPEFSPRTLRIFHNGEDVHERLTKYLRREHSLKFRDELDVPRDELDVHGRCDGICTIDQQAVVVEFKSINRSSVPAAKDEHLGQITWYMAMWRLLRRRLKEDFGYEEDDFVRPEDLQSEVSLSGRTLHDLEEHERWVLFTQGDIRGEIIYESKQTQQTFHFPVELNDDRYNKVRLWFEQLKWHIETKRRPIVRYDQNKFPCSWGRGATAGRCPYYETCYGNESTNNNK